MEEQHLERSKNRKNSQLEYRKNSFSSKFTGIEVEVHRNNSRMQSNDKIISIIGENLLKTLKNSSTSLVKKENTSNVQPKPNNKNINKNIKDKRLSKCKEKETTASTETTNIKSVKKNSLFENFPRMWDQDINLIFNGMPIKKNEEELSLDHDINKIETFLKSITDKNKTFKIHENKESNYSSSNIGFMNTTKTMSMRSEEKNTKLNLFNIMDNDRRIIKRDCPCIILSDKINIENNENKLDLLIKLMEEYKEIIMEKIFCKNFQDRIILSIYISLSQISLKLYNCTENNNKLNNLRKYICGLTDNIKYDLFSNPNFTMSSINQKFIEIKEIKNQTQNPINIDENKKNDSDDSDNKSNSSLNFSSKNSSNSHKQKEKYRWFYDDEEEEIIYENFEDFNENDKDKDNIYGNANILFEVDNQKDNNPILNNLENNFNFHKNNEDDNNAYKTKISKNKSRRNATHKIAFEKKETNKFNILNHNTTNTINIKPKDYNFQIIDINGNDNLENIDESDDSIDSEEGFYEVTENHKNDLPKLVFFEEHVKDKDKRKISKNNHVEIRPDQNFLKDKTRIKELNDIGFNNIITIINKNPNVLPSHELNLNPFEISEFIQEREKRLELQNTAALNENNSKKDEESKKSGMENKNISFLSKSGSFFHDADYSRNKIFIFGNEEDEDEDN